MRRGAGVSAAGSFPHPSQEHYELCYFDPPAAEVTGAPCSFSCAQTTSSNKGGNRCYNTSFSQCIPKNGYPYDQRGNYVLPAATEDAIRAMKLPLSRLYGVGAGGIEIEAALDRAAKLCQRTGIPPERMILELEIQSADKSLAPDIWARAARHSRKQSYGFHLWEVGNEVYGPALWGSKTGAAYPTPDDYVAHVQAVAKAIRAAQPDARIGLSVSDQSLRWGNYVLRCAAGSYDFVCPHLYSGADLRKPLEHVVIDDNLAILERVATLRALLAAYNPGKNVTILDSEWALYGKLPGDNIPEDQVRNRNITSVLHRAARLIFYAQTNWLEGASGWEMLGMPQNPGYGMLLPVEPKARSINAEFYRLWNERMTGTLLAARTTGPRLALSLAARDSQGVLHIVIVNASGDKPLPVSIGCGGAVQKSSAVILTQPALDAPAFDASALPKDLATKVDGTKVTLEAPPRSVVFVTIARLAP